jgi:hypothetical protein
VLNLAKTSNVGLTGRWMFRVDGEVIEPAVIVDSSGNIICDCCHNFYQIEPTYLLHGTYNHNPSRISD